MSMLNIFSTKIRLQTWASFGKLELDDKGADYVKRVMCDTVLKWKSKDRTGLSCAGQSKH